MSLETNKIKVMQAYSDGKAIEYYNKVQGIWEETKNPQWNWEKYDYRVKENKRHDEIKGLVNFMFLSDNRIITSTKLYEYLKTLSKDEVLMIKICKSEVVKKLKE